MAPKIIMKISKAIKQPLVIEIINKFGKTCHPKRARIRVITKVKIEVVSNLLFFTNSNQRKNKKGIIANQNDS